MRVARAERQAPTRAERQAQTRKELVDAAERLFTAQGFHATSIDAVAAEAGFTKGAVYSNFASKEDLFFAVYERRVDGRVAELEAILEDAPTMREAIVRFVPGQGDRPPASDGWMAVFFEFWAHALRHPQLRERFAAQHRRVIEVLAGAMVESGERLPEDPLKLATARYAMQVGLQLERLTQPDVVDEELGLRMGRLLAEQGGLDGLSDQAPSGHGARNPREQGAREA
jgi:AcrR family transcriptional regulator